MTALSALLHFDRKNSLLDIKDTVLKVQKPLHFACTLHENLTKPHIF